MTRISYLIGILILSVALNWIGTFYVFDMLPERLPLAFGSERPYDKTGQKTDIFYFPGCLTILAAVSIALFPVRNSFLFPGRRGAKKLPGEVKQVVFNRIYEVFLVIGIFLVLIVSYVQTSIILFALDVIAEIRAWPLLAALVVLVLYIVFNLLLIRKTVLYLGSQAGEENEQQ